MINTINIIDSIKTLERYKGADAETKTVTERRRGARWEGVGWRAATRRRNILHYIITDIYIYT